MNEPRNRDLVTFITSEAAFPAERRSSLQKSYSVSKRAQEFLERSTNIYSDKQLYKVITTTSCSFPYHQRSRRNGKNSDVVHPLHSDLYMYTHQGLPGTSRPTHYNLIHAYENDITLHELTKIVYHLTHCYSRTTLTVSSQAPTKCAHLAP